MTEKIKIYIASAADRDALCAMLARNGYTVRQGRERKTERGAFHYYVEFWI